MALLSAFVLHCAAAVRTGLVLRFRTSACGEAR